MIINSHKLKDVVHHMFHIFPPFLEDDSRDEYYHLEICIKADSPSCMRMLNTIHNLDKQPELMYGSIDETPIQIDAMQIAPGQTKSDFDPLLRYSFNDNSYRRFNLYIKKQRRTKIMKTNEFTMNDPWKTCKTCHKTFFRGKVHDPCDSRKHTCSNCGRELWDWQAHGPCSDIYRE